MGPQVIPGHVPSRPAVLCLQSHSSFPSAPFTHRDACPLHLHRPPTAKSDSAYVNTPDPTAAGLSRPPCSRKSDAFFGRPPNLPPPTSSVDCGLACGAEPPPPPLAGCSRWKMTRMSVAVTQSCRMTELSKSGADGRPSSVLNAIREPCTPSTL
uniref:Uncharacterized protein n=1 Tax=Anopheles merus TaxID=30066 RepID=A0A182ULW2_ANOME